MKQLSIILPVYKVERYIRACVESIFRQGLSDDCFELIIVDDGTPDDSMAQIADIIGQHANVSVVRQPNQGLSIARNNGMTLATGEYILMPDSDDLLVAGSLKPLLEKALSCRADLVVADFLEMSDEQIAQAKPVSQPALTFTEKTGEALLLDDLNPQQCYVWRTLYRRQFLTDHHLQFMPGVFFEDVPFTHACYLKAQRCLRTPWLLNVYRRGHASVTVGKFTYKKAQDFCTVIAKTWELTHDDGLSTPALTKLRNDVFKSFSVFLYSAAHDLDASHRAAIMDQLRQQAPDLHFDSNARQRAASFMLRHAPHALIHLRHAYAVCMEDSLLPALRHLRTRIARRLKGA